MLSLQLGWGLDFLETFLQKLHDIDNKSRLRLAWGFDRMETHPNNGGVHLFYRLQLAWGLDCLETLLKFSRW